MSERASRAKANSINVWTNYCFYASFVNFNVGVVTRTAVVDGVRGRRGYHYDVVNINECGSGRRKWLPTVFHFVCCMTAIKNVNLKLISWTIFQSLKPSIPKLTLSKSLKLNQLEAERRMMKWKTFFLPLSVQWSVNRED